jgi:ABC-2 type transport system permease protein
MNILKRELRANFKSLIIWSIIVLLFITVGFSKFSAYEGNPELLAILDEMPPAMLEAFNFNAFNLTTITGFFGVMFTYFALILSISAAMWGTDIITKEERDKTVEFALTLPVKRSKLVTFKTLAAVINSLVLLLVTWVAVLLNSTAYQTDSAFFEFLSLSMVSLFFMQMIFLAIGVLLGCSLKQFKRASAIAVSILLGTYLLSVISGLNESLDFLKYFTPFKYFNPADLLHESTIDVTYVILSVIIVAFSLVVAHLTYSKRDLYI